MALVLSAYYAAAEIPRGRFESAKVRLQLATRVFRETESDYYLSGDLPSELSDELIPPIERSSSPPDANQLSGLAMGGRSTSFVISGAPGAGKSFTLRAIAAQLARRTLVEESAPLPIYVAAHGLIPRGEFEDDLTDYVAKTYDLPRKLADSSTMKGDKLVLILDGLDESSDPIRLMQEFQSWRKDRPEVICIASCRSSAIPAFQDYLTDLSTIELSSPGRGTDGRTGGIDQGYDLVLRDRETGQTSIAQVKRRPSDSGYLTLPLRARQGILLDAMRPDRKYSAAELGSATALTPQETSEALDHLESAGLISRLAEYAGEPSYMLTDSSEADHR
ncbi:NACHT domain-containing protein [Pseudofrankia sp. DC12]|uniref:NACHT domain-containing protein n=1 Tax=Pseudofrankia sp. DC12 TaxID=683315 RepID=UPI000A7242B6|nr:NACHT domain-containing protein [Pseudofrankia sp. DC12]